MVRFVVITAPNGNRIASADVAFNGVKLTLSTAQSVASSSVDNIAWVTEIWDDNGFWAAGDPTQIVVRETGRFQLLTNLMVENSGAGTRALIVNVNGTKIVEVESVNSAVGNGIGAGVQFAAVANDVITVQIFQNSGGPLNVGGDQRSFVCVNRIK